MYWDNIKDINGNYIKQDDILLTESGVTCKVDIAYILVDNNVDVNGNDGASLLSDITPNLYRLQIIGTSDLHLATDIWSHILSYITAKLRVETILTTCLQYNITPQNRKKLHKLYKHHEQKRRKHGACITAYASALDESVGDIALQSHPKAILIRQILKIINDIKPEYWLEEIDKLNLVDGHLLSNPLKNMSAIKKDSPYYDGIDTDCIIDIAPHSLTEYEPSKYVDDEY